MRDLREMREQFTQGSGGRVFQEDGKNLYKKSEMEALPAIFKEQQGGHSDYSRMKNKGESGRR